MLRINRQLHRSVNSVYDRAMNGYGGERESLGGIVDANFGPAKECSILANAMADRAVLD